MRLRVSIQGTEKLASLARRGRRRWEEGGAGLNQAIGSHLKEGGVGGDRDRIERPERRDLPPTKRIGSAFGEGIGRLGLDCEGGRPKKGRWGGEGVSLCLVERVRGAAVGSGFAKFASPLRGRGVPLDLGICSARGAQGYILGRCYE